MTTFLMFGRYSQGAFQGISPKRTEQAVELIDKLGGEVQAMYATLGEHDLVLIVNFPGVNEAIKASVALGKMTGIAFSTAPAVTVEQFDQLVEEAV
jgi:uncharacterized protein with GYD domain